MYILKRKSGKIAAVIALSIFLLVGCQKAPEVSNDEEILRAKSDSDEAIEAIVGRENGEVGTAGTEAEEMSVEGEARAGSEMVSVVLGEGENRMRIEAQVAPAPEAASTLTMQADSRLDEAALRNFLDPQGEVKDFTEELLAEEAAERARVAEIDKKLGEGSSIVEMAGVGDDSLLALTDGNRKAVLSGRTGASYEDAFLQEKCNAAAQEIEEVLEKLDVKDGKAGDPSFPLQEAKALLLEKLSVLGIEDVYLTKAYFYGTESFSFYEMQFCPVVGGIPVAYNFGAQEISRVYPDGIARVSREGIADIGMWNCLMEQVSASDKENILSFDKVQELLAVYLKDGRLQCVEDVPFSRAELVYYVELKEGKLTLAPAWGIYMDLEEYVEYSGTTGRNDSVWTIHIDAATGELLEVQ